MERKLQLASRFDEHWRELTAEDFLEIGNNGKIYNKKEPVATLMNPQEAQDIKLTPINLKLLTQNEIIFIY